MNAIKEEQARIEEIEILEPRVMPGTLFIAPAGITDGTSNTIITSQPKFGLSIAHDRTGGIINWSAT